jgi:hypothetical protein
MFSITLAEDGREKAAAAATATRTMSARARAALFAGRTLKAGRILLKVKFSFPAVDPFGYV